MSITPGGASTPATPSMAEIIASWVRLPPLPLLIQCRMALVKLGWPGPILKAAGGVSMLWSWVVASEASAVEIAANSALTAAGGTGWAAVL